MSTTVQISSRDNPRFKQWKRLLRQPERPDVAWLAVEGIKAAGQLAETRPVRLLLVEEGRRPLPKRLRCDDTFELSKALFRVLSQVESSQGLIAFFDKPRFSWSDMPPWLLLLDRLQDPGNLGTLLRTAAATGCFGLVASPGSVSFFNPKLIRASAGLLFSTPFLEGVDAIELKQHGYRLYGAASGGASSLFDLPLEPPCGFAVGNEGAGLAAGILDLADSSFAIPMAPGVDSLNAAVAGSLIMYEVVRRRP